ncbi:Serine/threonine-protein kinase EDR1 [Acorus calamus]|uniref:non-specific serine/threonine protein kinase n=1 Tax=Acorus calamus TaxID=4465 RepID=A0AAV9CEM3_ACOCL|nr:Serine/threonine-protein kinase EDR1 [Acorus calamus]
MRNLLKKLHVMPGSSSSDSSSSDGKLNSQSGGKSSPPLSWLSPSRNAEQQQQQRPLSGLSNWLNSVTGKRGGGGGGGGGGSDRGAEAAAALDSVLEREGSPGSGGGGEAAAAATEAAADEMEEYQIQLALEMSAREDPEAVQIEAVKQISLGSCDARGTPAEVLAFRGMDQYVSCIDANDVQAPLREQGRTRSPCYPFFWGYLRENYNALSYNDKVLDGFYDLYGIMAEPSSVKMPSLVDLQGMPITNNSSCEAILVNRAEDADLLTLEQRALVMAVESGEKSLSFTGRDLVQKLAVLVADYMGGPVGDPERMLKAWKRSSNHLRSSTGNMVLADSIGVPCQLLKGKQYTGLDDGAVNIVKFNDGREFIVDLMGDPGTLIPSDTAGPQIEYEELSLPPSSSLGDVDNCHVASSSSGATSSIGGSYENEPLEKRFMSESLSTSEIEFNEKHNLEESRFHENQRSYSFKEFSGKRAVDNESRICDVSKSSCKAQVSELETTARPNNPYNHSRSPSWTEGVSSPAARWMKVNDVSQYMIDAAKENPRLAQKLHDVLLESGVVAPPDLFNNIYSEEKEAPMVEDMNQSEDKEEVNKRKNGNRQKTQGEGRPGQFLPPLPKPNLQQKTVSFRPQLEQLKPVDGMGVRRPLDLREATGLSCSSLSEKSSAQSQDTSPMKNDEADCAGYEQSGRSHKPDSSVEQEQDRVLAHQEAERNSDKSTGYESTKSDVALDDVAEWEIQWEEITLGERIGLGSYGEVYRGDWHGTIRIMKRLRHPNVVLFMGAITRVPNLSIVTEFLPRGSLFRLIHRPNNQLDERRRLRMALDVARGMNYLHNCTPIVVHRDLKSPNLLVDKNWVVKVCDFGLSRMKQSTFLSSRSTAGTAEWMAPEVLRNEPSDEKCDVYSFGVILWELSTLQQPWGGMNPMQVVGAVGFQERRLDIPEDMDPVIADIITKCWQTPEQVNIPRPGEPEVAPPIK